MYVFDGPFFPRAHMDPYNISIELNHKDKKLIQCPYEKLIDVFHILWWPSPNLISYKFILYCIIYCIKLTHTVLYSVIQFACFTEWDETTF